MPLRVFLSPAVYIWRGKAYFWRGSGEWGGSSEPAYILQFPASVWSVTNLWTVISVWRYWTAQPICVVNYSCFPTCVASASIGKGATLGGGPPSFNVGGMMFGGSAAGPAK